MILSFILVGLFTGVLAGLLGIGGGIITVPFLFFLLHFYNFETSHIMHTCIATSLATTAITSIGSTISHHKKRSLDPKILKLMAPGLILGCGIGAYLSIFLTSRDLQLFFGLMAIVFAIYFFFPRLPIYQIADHPNKYLLWICLLIGFLSSILGIGGGMFIIPVLLSYNVPLKQTIANSAAGTLVSATTGTCAYLILSNFYNAGPNSIGFIYVPAMLIIGICSLCSTHFGCKLAHSLPQDTIKRIFALALGATGISMIFI